MRNRFISDYIHRTTGKYRSAKQVGSRLQQLRDTAEGRELIDSLTRCYHTRTGPGSSNARVSICHPTPWAPSSSPQFSTISCDTASWDSSSTSSSSDSPATPSDYSPIMSPVSSSKQRQPTDSRMPVYIDILPEHPRWSSTAYGSSIPSHAPVASSSVGSSSHGPSFRPSDAARHMRDIDPTVTFVSPSPVNGKSSYIVLLDGAPVHSEDTKLEYVGPYYSSSSSSSAGQNSGNGPVLYTTALVPKYWDILCKAADPTLYTIIQDVYRAPDPVPNQGFSQRPRPVLIFSAIYHFQYLASLDSSTTASNIQSPPVGPAMTSALDDQVLHDYLNPMRPMPFQKYSVYPTPTPEKSWTTPTMEQNVFDEPFMLDVNFDDVRFDDFTVNIQDSPDGTPRASSGSFYPTDTNAFVSSFIICAM
ncbi:hypothetical protein BS17DRAFT_708933 [Gyrodon lividus]|nr:hypothetical protein BS17DRAFT_708933 [Gyrodon lividus]